MAAANTFFLPTSRYTRVASAAVIPPVSAEPPTFAWRLAAVATQRRHSRLPWVSMRILLISGSTRAASTNTAALRAMHEAAPNEVETAWYDGLAEFPAFNPDDTDSPPPQVAALTAAISAADAVLFCT